MTVPGKIRLLLVHSDATVRQGLVRVLGQHPWVEVVGAAMNGRTALPKVVSYRPDCVVIGVEQNEGEELDLLEYLQRSHPGIVPLAVTSPRTSEAGMAAVQGMAGVELLRRGEVETSEGSVARLAQDLVAPLLRRLSRPLAAAVETPPRVPALPEPSLRPAPAIPTPAVALPAGVATAPAAVATDVPPRIATTPPLSLPRAGRSPRVLGIGVSTGGPKALTQFLPSLPADFAVPIVVVQHMPPKFTKSLAESLDRLCHLRVREAEANDRVERGTILIAPGGMHLRVIGSEHAPLVRLTEDPPECSCRPSVDYLFRSLVEVFGARTLGVVLTGMGEDGWLGARGIHDAGGQVLAQDEATSTVFGMPRGPIEAGIAPAVPLDRMAEAVLQVCRGVACN